MSEGVRFIRVNGRIVPIKGKSSGPGKLEKGSNVVAKVALGSAGAAIGTGAHSFAHGAKLRGFKFGKAAIGLFGVGLGASVLRDQLNYKRHNGDSLIGFKGMGERISNGVTDVASIALGTTAGFHGLNILNKHVSKLSKYVKFKTAKVVNPNAFSSGAKTAKKSAKASVIKKYFPFNTGL